MGDLGETLRHELDATGFRVTSDPVRTNGGEEWYLYNDALLDGESYRASLMENGRIRLMLMECHLEHPLPNHWLINPLDRLNSERGYELKEVRDVLENHLADLLERRSNK